MDMMDACEQAYRNGYNNGLKDAQETDSQPKRRLIYAEQLLDNTIDSMRSCSSVSSETKTHIVNLLLCAKEFLQNEKAHE